MTTQTFEISIGLDTHRIEVAEDPASGKATVRLDGRMAARPLSSDELSRQVRVGSELYEVRRSRGSFDLEFMGVVEGAAPAVATAASPLVRSAPEPKSTFPVFRVIAVVLVASAVTALVPWIKDAWGSGWYRHNATDRTFSFQMPVPPKSEKYDASGIPVTEYFAAARGNEYYVGVAEIPHLKAEHENLVVNRVRDGLLRRHKAVKLSERSIPWGVEVLGRDNKGETDFKFRVILNGKRIYVVGAAAPEGKMGRVTIQRFFATFKYVPAYL